MLSFKDWPEEIIFARTRIAGIDWLLGPKSKLSLDNKLLFYKAVMKLWGCASKSSLKFWDRSSMLIGSSPIGSYNLNQEFVDEVLKVTSVPFYKYGR